MEAVWRSLLSELFEVQARNGGAGLENILGRIAASFNSGGNVAFLEATLEIRAEGRLDAQSGGTVFLLEFRQIRRNGDGFSCGIGRERVGREDTFDALGIEPPFRDEPIGGEAVVQRAIREAIAIRQVAAHDGAEAREVEARIFQLEWIEGPFDERDAALESILALK